jgi:hypothetical protein
LTLVDDSIGGREIRVAVAKEGGAVVRERFEFTFCSIDVGFEVTEADVNGVAAMRGDVLLFDAHLVKLFKAMLS